MCISPPCDCLCVCGMHVHMFMYMWVCVYICVSMCRGQRLVLNVFIVLHCAFSDRVSHRTWNIWDSVRLAAQQVPRIFMLHRWDYRHMLLCQAFSSFPYLYTIKYDHIYPHFLPSNLLFSSSLSPKFKSPFFS